MAFDENLADRIQSILEGRKGLESKLMFGGVAFMLNGRMCCGVMKEDLMVRVDEARYQALLKKPGARPMDFAHRPMKGFLYVDPKGCKTEVKLRFWVEESAGYAMAQSPKGKAKKKAAKKTTVKMKAKP